MLGMYASWWWPEVDCGWLFRSDPMAGALASFISTRGGRQRATQCRIWF